MLTEILIIIAYFTGMLVPVATVVVFLRLDANPETARLLPKADTYYMPDEGQPSGGIDDISPPQLRYDGTIADE